MNSYEQFLKVGKRNILWLTKARKISLNILFSQMISLVIENLPCSVQIFPKFSGLKASTKEIRRFVFLLTMLEVSKLQARVDLEYGFNRNFSAQLWVKNLNNSPKISKALLKDCSKSKSSRKVDIVIRFTT